MPIQWHLHLCGYIVTIGVLPVLPACQFYLRFIAYLLFYLFIYDDVCCLMCSNQVPSFLPFACTWSTIVLFCLHPSRSKWSWPKLVSLYLCQNPQINWIYYQSPKLLYKVSKLLKSSKQMMKIFLKKLSITIFPNTFS